MKTLAITYKPRIMKNLLYIIIFVVPLLLAAQTKTENYIKTTTYRAPSTGAITENDTLVNVTYFDGLGRPKQSVAVRAGGQGQDIVTPVVYDAFGRQSRDYLPYAVATQNGNIHVDPLAELEAFYNVKYPNAANPYSEKILENSPLNRVMEQGAPGAAWMADPASDSDHTIKFEYGTNVLEEVRLYKATTTADHYSPGLSTYIPTLENPGFYNAGSLYKTITKDENWQPGDGSLHTTEEFKDFQGRVVLKRTYADMPGAPQAAHDTYYVYDKFGNLSFVIPPKVDTSDGVSPEELDELCYQYVYDHRNRLVEKKLPGKGWEYIVYNKLDQPVLTQDANQQAESPKVWLFSKYDKFGRVVYTGLYSSNLSRQALQMELEGHSPLYEAKADTPTLIDGTEVYYSNVAFPDTGVELLTIHYYDRYNFDLAGGTSESSYGIIPIIKPMTLATGNKTRILGTDQWVTTVMYYDKKGRSVYTYSRNDYLDITDKVKTKLSFVGEVLEITSVHTKDGEKNITSIDKFSYDHTGRLLKHTHHMAGQQEETLAENVYDELGQLIQKKVGNHSAAPLQTVDYSYNIRGWLKQINDVNNMQNDLFSFGISYNDPTANGTALYNGNISQTRWRTNNTDNSLKHYNYNYDALNRITNATDNTGNYNLNGVTYDKNGNILSLSRQGHIDEDADNFGIMDDLIYSYDSGNKLIKVDESADALYGFKDKQTEVDYSYDLNGNMIADANKEITNISYNHLNMPTEITFNNNPNRKINYIYTADGIKQQKVVTDNAVITTTDYAEGYIYENGSLKFINHSEGYIEPDGGGNYSYVYQYKDHLGNIRLSYSDSNDDGLVDNSEIIEENNYYPFGLEHRGYNDMVTGVKNNIKTYQGQELTEDLELNIHEWKYRISDPATGRFWQIDPLAEDYVYNGTYNFAENRVIDSAELEGLERIYAADGKFINQVGDSQEIRVMHHNDGNAQGLIDIANNTELSSEERSKAVNTLNDNSFHGYSSTDEAAGNFAYNYNAESIANNQEAGSAIFNVLLTDADGNDAGTVSVLSPVVWGDSESVSAQDMINSSETQGLDGSSVPIQMPGELSGFVHTHGRGSNDLSTGGVSGLIGSDEIQSKDYGVPVYMSNKRGDLKVLDYKNSIYQKRIRSNIPTKKKN